MATKKKQIATSTKSEIDTSGMDEKKLSFFQAFVSVDNLMDISITHAVGADLAPPKVIKTGSHALNDALGCGGVACGRVIQYYGPPGCGKSFMAMQAMINAQEEDPTAEQLFIDAEQTFNTSWFAKLGGNPKKVTIIDGETAIYGRNCFELLLGIPKEDSKTHAFAGKIHPGLLDRIANKEYNVNLIVLDSLGSLIPPGEDTSRIGKMNMALMARFLSTTMKKLTIAIKKANIPMIIINHIKATMETYGLDHTSSGGNSYFHTLSGNIYFEPVSRKDAQIFDAAENKIGATIKFSIEKTKYGPPRKGEFRMLFNSGVIDKHIELISLGLRYGVISKLSTVTYEYEGEKIKSAAGLADYFKDNEIRCNSLLEKINEAKNSGVEGTAIKIEDDSEERDDSVALLFSEEVATTDGE